ncbi:hypothetical protein C8Q78DRAFT_1093730 [Trametes maxima]|nr:hypothetical protein C8Q78DRAFT_1093730 [Trametes maxima]
MTTSRILPHDVIHEILIRVPDFATLAAAVRLSRAFYNVFQDHPKLITHSVLENVVGFALPQAKRLAQYDRQQPDDPRPLNLAPEAAFQGMDWVLSRETVRQMERDANIVRILENLYSMRYKDRKSPTSVLEPTESLKFQRALYRYWLCFKILEAEGYWWKEDGDEDSDDEDEDVDEEVERQEKLLHDGFCGFLKDVPTQELLEILEIRAFLGEMRTWLMTAYWITTSSIGAVIVSPLPQLSAQGCSLIRASWNLYATGYGGDSMCDAARELLRARKVPDQQLLERSTEIIVGSARGAEDSCSRCNATCGNKLMGSTNMFVLAGIVGIHEKISLFPGHLSRNPTEIRRIVAYFIHNKQSVSDDIIVYRMMDMDNGDASEHWSKDGWYCVACLKELFRQRFMLWWRETKPKDGARVQDDCWYGYNCRTMTHRPEHAEKLNHLCVPTRGDAPAPAAGPGPQAT